MSRFPRLRSLLSTVLAVSFLVLLMSPISQVFAASSTRVSGSITSSGNPVAGAQVTVRCSNGHTKKTTSNSSGNYSVTFGTTSTTNCPNVDTISLTVTTGTLHGSGIGTMQNNAITINVICCPKSKWSNAPNRYC